MLVNYETILYSGEIMKFVKLIKTLSLLFITHLLFIPSVNAVDSELLNLDITTSFPAIIALVVFASAYMFVMAEEYTHLRKSKPNTGYAVPIC